MRIKYCFIPFLFLFGSYSLKARPIYFCGEEIPVDKDFVAEKLMNIIRKQIPTVNMPSLRYRAMQYFPYIDNYLRLAGIPTDFKYLPIVESNFQNITSRVGAQGFWQLMPAVAVEKGLVVNGAIDERNDIVKATGAAAKLLAEYYLSIFKRYKIYSWVLTAAAYNFGIGNIFKAIGNQGSDYFSMNLNPETAIYVYKIIAIKELFEYPELYMKNIGYNVFNSNAKKITTQENYNTTDFNSMSVKVSKTKNKPIEKPLKSVYVAAHIKGKYKNFQDGDLISIELNENLIVKGGYTSKKSIIKGTGWIIDGRIYIDLGYGHEVTLYDQNSQKGVDLSMLKKDVPVLLKNDLYEDED